MLFGLISLMVRSEVRASWLARREANLNSLWILVDRGELAGDLAPSLAWLYRDAFSNAFEMRWSGFDPRRWIRGPAFVLTAAASAVLLIAAVTHGFAETRSLPNANSNKLMANLFPAVFALITSLMVAACRLRLPGRGWRSLGFFLLKTISMTTVALLLWVEGGAALRASIPDPTVRAIVGGVLPAAMLAGGLSWAMLWSIADQQHRCSVCLRRLIAPVRVGSCASIFEPATIEWLCEEGHGALCEPGIEPCDHQVWTHIGQ